MKHDSIERKFIDSVEVIGHWEIESEEGFVPITHIHKTVEYVVYEVTLANGLSLQCADTHILMNSAGEEVFAYESLGEYIKTALGDSIVVSVESLGRSEHMYDATVDSDAHTYYTNDILSHNTQTNAALVLHYLLFEELKTVAILANKASMAREILNRIKQMYSALPLWMQQGVTTWNKGSIELGNGCTAIAAATSSSAIRGFSISWCLLDEAAFIPDRIAAEFFESTYPTISSGNKSKISIFSTPKGMNFFYKMWSEAVSNTSEFKHFEATWRDVPTRDEAWAKTTRKNVGEDAWNQEYEGLFTGATGTLISSTTLRNIPVQTPLHAHEKTRIYEEPKKDHHYMLTIDVARGGGDGDNSAITVSDVSSLPYKQVAVYTDNTLSYLLLPGIAVEMAKKYNNGYILVELNDNGEAVADSIVYEYEYDYVLTTGEKKGKIVLGSWVNSKNGVRTTKSTKKNGCSNLKALVESGNYIIKDFDTLKEASNFVSKGGSYSATSGNNDDIMMTLVIFAWAVNQEFFKELFESDFKTSFIEKSHEEMMGDLAPIGFFDGFGDSDDDFDF